MGTNEETEFHIQRDLRMENGTEEPKAQYAGKTMRYNSPTLYRSFTKGSELLLAMELGQLSQFYLPLKGQEGHI